jgi:tetratricopeptide (TPR) repeat protein
LRSNAAEFVGRDEELNLLLRRWEFVKSGNGRVVLLAGEPGIGKSRLARALEEGVAGDRHTSLSYHCSPHHQDSALHPIVGQILRAAGIEGDDDTETKLDKLEALLGRSSQDLSGDIPLFASLLSIPGGNRFSLPALTPQQLKSQTLSALLGQLDRLGAQAPVLIVFEDLHWIDPTSLELLSLIVDRAPRLKLMLIATFRPEFTVPWASHPHISLVSLNRLSKPEGATLAASTARGKALPREILDQITERSDGVPLFIEELTKTMLESGLLQEVENRHELKEALLSLSIPTTLHASLLERLDRLGSVRDLAQIGAACGREFSYKLIAAASSLPEPDLVSALTRLVEAQLLFQLGVAPDATYMFKHALVQDAAYATLTRSRRQQLHQRLSLVLEERFPDIVSAEPETLAHHFTEAGLTERAIEYWYRAGVRSAERSAHVEAVKHLSRPIAMLRASVESADTLRKELEIRIALGPSLIAVKTSRSPAVEALYLRARELVDRCGTIPQRFPVLWGLWFNYYSRGRYTEACEVGERLLEAAQGSNDSGQLLESHHALWATRSAMGHAADALAHIKQGMSLYDRKLHESHTALYGGHDAEVCNRYHLAVNLWLLGHPDQALGAITEGLRRGEELNHPLSRIIALWYAAWIYYQRGDRPGMVAHCEQLLALASEHKIQAMTEVATFLANVDASRSSLELAALHEAILRGIAGGVNWQRVFCQCVLTDLHREQGRIEEGLAVLASIPPQERTVIYAPEILRLEGELKRRLPSPRLGEVERLFQAALALARERGEKSLELRAALSLACLWCEQGKRSEAHQVLKPVYDWFREGHDLPDLRSANAFLCELEARGA